MLLPALGLMQFAFTEAIRIEPEIYDWGFSVRTNQAQIALMRIDLYPTVNAEALALRALSFSQADLITNLYAGESNARLEADTLRLQAEVERKAWSARVRAERVKWFAIGAGSWIAISIIYAVIVGQKK